MDDQILKTVLMVAAEVFERDVTADDSFFALGGDSVHAVDFGIRLEEQLGVEVAPALLVSTEDFAALAAELRT